MDEAGVAQYFDATADDYTSGNAVDDLDAYPLAEGYLPVRAEPGDRLLEIGCGGGLLLRYLVENTPVSEAVGIDVSREMVRKCRPHEAIEHAVGSATALPFRPGSFDFVVYSDVLHHLVGDTRRESKAKAAASLDRAVDLLADDGHLLVKDIYYDSPVGPDSLTSHLIFHGLKHFGGLASRLDSQARPGLVVSFYTRDELAGMIRAAGASIRKAEVVPEQHESLPRRLFAGDIACVRFYAGKGDDPGDGWPTVTMDR